MIASCPLADKPLRPPRLRVAPSGPAARSSRAAPPPHSTSQVHKHAPRVGDLWEAVWASFVAMAHESLRFCACTKPAPPNASRDGMRLRAVPRACPYRLKCGSAGARCAHDAGREGGRTAGGQGAGAAVAATGQPHPRPHRGAASAVPPCALSHMHHPSSNSSFFPLNKLFCWRPLALAAKCRTLPRAPPLTCSS